MSGPFVRPLLPGACSPQTGLRSGERAEMEQRSRGAAQVCVCMYVCMRVYVCVCHLFGFPALALGWVCVSLARSLLDPLQNAICKFFR